MRPLRFLSGHEESDDLESVHDEMSSVVVLLFLILALVMCNVSQHILSRYNDVLPYTVVVFVLGMACAGFANMEFFRKSGDTTIGPSIDSWVNFDAYLLLFVFLPVLLFGEAMSLNWHRVKGSFVQTLLMAGPGVMIGAATVGMIVKGVLPASYNWDWYLCMTFGSILSATDPVAVVSLLKSAGAPPKLTMLIVGESLMNDGTAVVLFDLFFELFEGHTFTAGQIVGFFFEAAIVSPIVGFLCGFMALRWLRLADRPLHDVDHTIQIVITVTCAYFSFFVSQYVFTISGVLSCVAAGLMFAWLAPPLILNHHTMHNVWNFLEWMSNTLIFLIAGLYMGDSALNNVTWQDWLIMPCLYLVLMFSRVVVLTVLYPFISTTGLKCSLNEAIFMAFAGLRGALAIALAIIVDDSEHIDEESGARFLFYVAGIATMTIVINGTMAKNVLLYLGLIGVEGSFEEEIIKKDLFKVIIDSHKIQAGETEADHAMAVQFRQRIKTLSVCESVEVDYDTVSPELLVYVRAVFLDLIGAKYHHIIAHGHVPRHSHVAQLLHYSVEAGADWTHDGVCDWRVIEEYLDEVTPDFHFMVFLAKRFKVDFILDRLAWMCVDRNKRAALMLTAFVEAHEHAQTKIKNFIGVPSSGKVTTSPEEAAVLSESNEAIKLAKEGLMLLSEEMLTAVHDRQTTKESEEIVHNIGVIKRMEADGLLSSKNSANFLSNLAEELQVSEAERGKLYRQRVDIMKGKLRVIFHRSGCDVSSYLYRTKMTALPDSKIAQAMNGTSSVESGSGVVMNALQGNQA